MGRYRQILAVVAVVLFFSNVDLYLYLADYTSATPRDWVTLFAALLLPLLVHGLHRGEIFEKQLSVILLWSLAYMTVSVVWYSLSPSDGAVQELRDRFFSVFFLGLTAFAFVKPESRRVAGLAAIVVVIVTVIINGVQMIQPDWFVMYVTTRASGLYANANQCGAALVMGMIVGSPLVPRRLRLAFYLLVGAGLALTFSRSTTVGWVMASAVLLSFDSSKARAREFVVGGLAAAMLLLVLLQGALSSGLLDGMTLDENQSDRISFFRTFEASDNAAQERREVASKAWGMFLANPIQGNGLASTVQWTERASTHNMFLYLMADHGVLGALILPTLLACVLLGRSGAAQGPHWAFCLFTFWYAFFSHNILVERYCLLVFAFFAMGGIDNPSLALARARQRIGLRPALTTYSPAVEVR